MADRIMSGQALREWRQSHKLSQPQLADMVGRSYIQIGRYERGDQPVPLWMRYVCWAVDNGHPVE